MVSSSFQVHAGEPTFLRAICANRLFKSNSDHRGRSSVGTYTYHVVVVAGCRIFHHALRLFTIHVPICHLTVQALVALLELWVQPIMVWIVVEHLSMLFCDDLISSSTCKHSSSLRSFIEASMHALSREHLPFGSPDLCREVCAAHCRL